MGRDILKAIPNFLKEEAKTNVTFPQEVISSYKFLQ